MILNKFFNRNKKQSTLDFKKTWLKGSKLIKKGKNEEAKTMLKQASNSGNTLERHYARIKLLMILKDDEKIKTLCEESINDFSSFYEAWVLEHPGIGIPYAPFFPLLADIYEKEKQYKKALEVSETAQGYELKEEDGNHFTERIERLNSLIMNK